MVTVTADAYDQLLSALRDNTENLAAWVGIWACPIRTGCPCEAVRLRRGRRDRRDAAGFLRHPRPAGGEGSARPTPAAS